MPVMASSSGIPAATSVPNAMTSRISVIGSELNVAFARSLLKTSMIASSELPEPIWSTTKSPWAFLRASV